MRFQLEKFAFWLVIQFARVIPRSFLLAAGRFFGSCAYVLDRRHRIVALENFEAAFPDVTANERSSTIRNCYRFFGSYLFDMLSCLGRGFPAKRMNDFDYQGLDHLDAAYAAKKGVIFITAHWGAWEMMGVAHGYKGYPLGVMARALDNPYLEGLLRKFRTSTGNFVVDKREGFRPMLKAMRDGKGIAILIDQNVGTEERIFVNFFGRPAATTPAVGLVKLKTDCALIPVFALPLERNRYRFIYGAPVDVPLTNDRTEDVARITQECTRVIEDMIRQHPQYWLWMHRRWKTQPLSSSEAQAPLPVHQEL